LTRLRDSEGGIVEDLDIPHKFWRFLAPRIERIANHPSPLKMGCLSVTKTLGDKISKRRLDLGLTQGQMAEKIGVSRRALIRWQKGRYKPRKENLVRVVSFGVKI